MSMAKPDIFLEKTIERPSMRHFINGFNSVYHCHHYTSLYTQLAIDAGETELLFSSAEHSFYLMLTDYFDKNGIDDLEEREASGCQLFEELGLGTLAMQSLGDYSGRAIMPVSHVDAGWLKKWGTYDKPVNYIGAGFIAALAAAVLELPAGSFQVQEVRSIVKGAPASEFSLIRK